jgi:integrase
MVRAVIGRWRTAGASDAVVSGRFRTLAAALGWATSTVLSTATCWTACAARPSRLTRLAADTGARRGELAALKFSDLSGRVLTIARAASMEQIGPTKTRQTRRITLGTTTSTLWHSLVVDWRARLPDGGSLGDWLFSPDPDHRRRLTTSHLAHSFFTLRTQAGIPNVTLHQLRHSVATFLVDRGR